MSEPKLSVVVPTRNRPEKLRATLDGLAHQENLAAGDYEVIVVDDGSDPPAAFERPTGGPAVNLVRLGGNGRSEARNRGADAAEGKLVVFVDDDVMVAPTFLAGHWQAHLEWPEALQIGATLLPDTAMATPFGRFRQRLEQEGVPGTAGPVRSGNFIATAQNMAITHAVFERLGGFDRELSVGEDQDLALRHTRGGGEIVFVPAASALHDDDALTVESYCDRAERYMEEMVRFMARYPDLSDNIERARVNGPVRWGREPANLSAKKLLKGTLLWAPVRAAALRLISIAERFFPDSKLVDKLYRMLLGAHLLRGYRRGLRRAHG